jgi:hypothetical protein
MIKELLWTLQESKPILQRSYNELVPANCTNLHRPEDPFVTDLIRDIISCVVFLTYAISLLVPDLSLGPIFHSYSSFLSLLSRLARNLRIEKQDGELQTAQRCNPASQFLIFGV